MFIKVFILGVLYWFLIVIMFKVMLGVCFFIIEVVVDFKYNGIVIGLMGNFDGDLNNDFVFLNGIIL